METFADKVNSFNRNLEFSGKLPKDIRILNPFKDNPDILPLSASFYQKYYHDTKPRRLILGINPGRLGAGSTGIPFTDTKRLQEVCGLKAPEIQTHEPSSVFIYQFIDAFGGPEAFYGRYYINSVCPLGFVRKNDKGKWINYNYYDDKKLFLAVKPFIIRSLQTQLKFGVEQETCWVLGKKNAQFLTEINLKLRVFKDIIALDHPRYVVQYKSRQMQSYIDRYLDKLH